MKYSQTQQDYITMPRGVLFSLSVPWARITSFLYTVHYSAHFSQTAESSKFVFCFFSAILINVYIITSNKVEKGAISTRGKRMSHLLICHYIAHSLIHFCVLIIIYLTVQLTTSLPYLKRTGTVSTNLINECIVLCT